MCLRSKIAVVVLRLTDQFDPWMAFRITLDDFCSAVRGTVVHDDPTLWRNCLGDHEARVFRMKASSLCAGVMRTYFIADARSQKIWRQSRLLHKPSLSLLPGGKVCDALEGIEFGLAIIQCDDVENKPDCGERLEGRLGPVVSNDCGQKAQPKPPKLEICQEFSAAFPKCCDEQPISNNSPTSPRFR